MGKIKALLLRAMIIYFITTLFRKPAATNNTQTPNAEAARNMFQDGNEISLYIYLSEFPEYKSFAENDLFWHKEKLIYGDWTSGPNSDGTYTYEKELSITENLRKNGSLYLHAYLTKFGESPDPRSKHYGKNFISYTKKALNRYVRYFVL